MQTHHARFGWNNLEPLSQVLETARLRSESRQTLSLSRAMDLNLTHVEPNKLLPRGGYMARIDGRDIPLGEGAVRGACRMIGAQPKMFKRAASPEAFPQMLYQVLDNPAAKKHGIKIRTGLAPNGITEQIAAILPPDYVVKDSHEQLADFASMLESHVGAVRGVSKLEQGYGDINSYRLVVGENVMPALDDLKGQFMMFVYSGSETGMCEDMTTLGLYRLICTNGAMRTDHEQLVAHWNHRANHDKFMSKSAETVRHVGYFSDVWGKMFQKAAATPLPAPARDMLHAVRETNLITRSHFDAAERQSGTGPVETQFDFFNLLTQSAQMLPSIQQREDAESRSMKLFTERGGVMERIRAAAERQMSNAPTPLIPDQPT